MQSTQLSLIVKKLTEFYGTEFNNFTYQSSLSPTKTYAKDSINDFVNDLIQEARKQQFLVVENYANAKEFHVLIEQSSHPIIFFDDSQGEIRPILAARKLKDE